jgi:transcriptional regulator with XRE-family HTH domain
MAGLGQVLREAREKKGSSWQEIEAATGLWPEYVQALEREDYSRFASEGHLRSALRLYARFLGLDVKTVLALLERPARRDEPRRREVRREEPGRRETVRREPSRRETLTEEPHRREAGNDSPVPWFKPLMVALAAMLTVGVCAVAAYYGYDWLRSGGSDGGAPGPVSPRGTVSVPLPTPTPSPSAYLPISSTSLPRYVISATLDYAGHSLVVQERMDYANRTIEALNDIVLNVFPNHEPDVFVLNDLSLEYGTGPVTTDQSLEEMALRVPLPLPLSPGQVVTLFLDYTLDLPYIDPTDSFTTGSLGWSERVADVGQWYPALAPLLPEEGWYTFDYCAIGDPYVMEVADYDVRIHAPEGVTVVAGGDLEREGTEWHYGISQARSFAFAASDQYVSHAVETGGLSVTSFYFAEHESAGVDVAQVAAEALLTYGEEFGTPYPYADYRVAESEFAGGMEFSGMSFMGSLWYETYSGGVRSQLIALLVHEVSHQWWYNLVGNDQVMEPWLDEAMATFSELVFYENRYPDDDLWLWDFEVLNWPRGGSIDGSIYDYQDEASYMNSVYRRGAMFLADLRQLVGSRVFHDFEKDYCQSRSHSLATAADFFAILSRHTDEDLLPLLTEYFAQPPVE